MEFEILNNSFTKIFFFNFTFYQNDAHLSAFLLFIW